MRPVQMLTMSSVGVVTAVALLGCGSGDPLSVTCGSYLKKNQQSQLDLAAKWATPQGMKTDARMQAVAAPMREQLINYCSVPSHEGDRLKDLVPGFGVGQ